MKASRSFIFANANQEYVLELRKKRKFPWWILLFLLLLIFLIPIDRTAKVKAVDSRNNLSIAGAGIKINYTFNDNTGELENTTDNDGNTEFVIGRQAIYKVLFGSPSGMVKINGSHPDYLPVSAEHETKTAVSKTKLLLFEKPGDDFRVVAVDSLTGELLPDVSVSIEYDNYNDSNITKSTGTADFKNVVLKPDHELIIKAGNDKYENKRQKVLITKAGEPKVDTIRLLSLDQGGMKGERGEVNVNLKWDSTDDLDIMLLTPCNDTIYFTKRELTCSGFVGKLDLDANAEGSELINDPQENIFWDHAPAGNYKVILVFYKKNKLKKVPYTVTLIIDEKKQIFTGEIKNIMKPEIIHEFTYGSGI